MTEKKSYQVMMPKLGLIMTEANLMEWHKQDGDWTQKGEPLFSFESDKSAVEIEAPASGYVQILVAAGTTVPVQTPVAIISTEKTGTGTGQPGSAGQEVKPARSPKASDTSQTIRSLPGIRATPKARNAARDMNVDLADVRGSGPRGMIVTADLTEEPQRPQVKATPLAQGMAADCGIDLAQVPGSGPGGRITRDDVIAAIAQLTRGKTAPAVTSRERSPLPLEGLRGLIAERLSISWTERPQVTLHSEVDATRLVELRHQIRTPTGEKYTLNAYFIAAIARTLAEFPQVNAQLTDDGLVHFNRINIGIAIDTERGLVVPVLKDVGRLSLLGIHDTLYELVQRTLSGKALPEEFSDGRFTLTNLGAFGVDSFTPIINPPEMAILGVGRIKAKPVAIEGMMAIREMVTLSLSFDHRLIDGAPAARFLQRICQFLEDPTSLK